MVFLNSILSVMLLAVRFACILSTVKCKDCKQRSEEISYANENQTWASVFPLTLTSLSGFAVQGSEGSTG